MNETKKTLYTMYQIKRMVQGLKYKAAEQYEEDITVKFEKHLETNAEMSMDISTYSSLANKMNELQKKYELNQYRDEISANLLKNRLEYKFRHADGGREKIFEQFGSIETRLKSMRNPDKALEFLKLCGIEFPEKLKPEEPKLDISVDPDFIKSVLPKQKLLTAE